MLWIASQGEMDRPLESRHLNHADRVYSVKYGYVSSVTGGDVEE